jgi:hypothetical protein
MHQHGIGLQKDNPLAKRYYDHAIEVNSEDALIPCSLAIISLFTEDYRKYLIEMMSHLTLEYFGDSIANFVEIYIGAEWDIYLGCFLLFILLFVCAFRRQH